MKLVCFNLVVVLISTYLQSADGHPIHDDSYSYDGHIDHLSAATDKEEEKAPVGKVQIKVYRGPSKGHGYHKFAPWGYWVKQPEDESGGDDEKEKD